MKIEGTVVEMRKADRGLVIVVVEGFLPLSGIDARGEYLLSHDEAKNVHIGAQVNVEITLTTTF